MLSKSQIFQEYRTSVHFDISNSNSCEHCMQTKVLKKLAKVQYIEQNQNNHMPT
jgi:hypothetical protein